jgi:hypothetical protein
LDGITIPPGNYDLSNISVQVLLPNGTGVSRDDSQLFASGSGIKSTIGSREVA